MGLTHRGERGVTVGDIKLDRQDGVPVLGGEVLKRRRVAGGGSDPVPRRERDPLNERPKPREAPVMNQVRSGMRPLYPQCA